MSSRFCSHSEADASEWLQNPEDMFPRYHLDSDVINITKYLIIDWCVIRRERVMLFHGMSEFSELKVRREISLNSLKTGYCFLTAVHKVIGPSGLRLAHYNWRNISSVLHAVIPLATCNLQIYPSRLAVARRLKDVLMISKRKIQNPKELSELLDMNVSSVLHIYRWVSTTLY